MTTPPTTRRRVRSLALGAVALAAGSALLAGVAHAQVTPTPIPEPTPSASACSAVTRMWARPDIVPAGTSARVTASVTVVCPSGEAARRHVVLVVDASSSMAGNTRTQVARAINEFVDRLPLEDRRTAVAVVQYQATAEVLCPLSADREVLRACVASIGAGGGSCIDCGVTAAHGALVSGRAGVPPGETVTESMIVLTDGANADGCTALTAAAADAKADGILLTTVALTSDADIACMRAAATSPRYFFEARQATHLFNILDTIRKLQLNGPIQRLTLRFVEAARLPFLTGSARPAAAFAEDGSVTWDQYWVPVEGITVSLELRPTAAGDLPAFSEAAGEIVDVAGAVAPITFDIPHIVALGGGALPTTTPAAASPVRTNGLTLSPPRPRAGERARLDYRLTLDDPIAPQGSHVMIVADTSGSMAGEPNLALKDALRGLVARLPIGHDPASKVGIVAFNNAGRTVVGLSDDRAAIETAIDDLGYAGGTCIDCGLRVGHDALALGRPAPGVEDVIVFTDGENNSGCGPVLAEADALKDQGVTVHAVCMVPNGCDKVCMRAAASPGHYLEVRRTADTAAAFATIGDQLLADRRYDAVAVRIALPPHLRLLPDTFDVAPEAVTDGGDARWTFRPLPLTGLSLSGEVEAVADGDAPAVAVSEGTERGGHVVRWVAEAPRSVPTPAATPTPTPRTPSPRATVYLPAAMRNP